MAAGAAVRLEPCSATATQVFALDGDSIIVDAKPELVVRLSSAITKLGTSVALGERWLSDDELWDFVKGINVVAVSAPAGARVYLHAIIDHNDISDWGVSAIDLQGPDDDDVVCPLAPQTDPGFVRILRNFIHDNRENHYANAEGYGLAAGSGSYPLVFANVFQKNGTSLTSDGAARSGYVARSDLFLSGNDSVDADVHGQTNDKNDTHHDGGISGLSGRRQQLFAHGHGREAREFFRAWASVQRGERDFQR